MRLLASLSFPLFFLSLISQQSLADELTPFSSDGCSLFPDSNLITKVGWCECCVEHDAGYWKGGTQRERKASDKRLKACLIEKTNNRLLAETMYQGVRVGGSPYFYNWYRWGYGWSQRRLYQPLTTAERDNAAALLRRYYQEQKSAACF